MLKIGIVEFLIRLAPESFFLIFGMQAFSNSKINRNKYILTSILLSIIMYSIRLLPIHYGVHTILNIIAIVLICIFINKITTIESITYTLILMSFLALSEAFNLYFIYKILGANIANTLENPVKKCIYSMPSIIILVIIGLFIFKIKNRRVKDVFD